MSHMRAEIQEAAGAIGGEIRNAAHVLGSDIGRSLAGDDFRSPIGPALIEGLGQVADAINNLAAAVRGEPDPNEVR